MLLVSQNTQDLCTNIQLFGCRFRCLQAIAEFESQKTLSCSQILDSYLYFIKDPSIMSKNCRCGIYEHKIINHTFSLLGSEKKGRQIGSMQNNVPMGWDNKICDFNYIILHWKTATSDGHYTLADKNGNELFDPWDNSQTKLLKLAIQRKLLYKTPLGC